MKKVGLIIFASALIIGVVVSNIFPFGRVGNRLFNFSVDFGHVRGSGNITSEKRDITGFKGVDVSGVFQVEVVAGKDFSVEVEADDNLLPLVKTEVSGGTLRIGLERRVKTSNPLKVRVSAPDISRIETSGASNVTLSGVKNSEIAVDSSGVSKVKISGETSKLNVDVSGASNINAAELKAENAAIGSSGASHVDVNVSGELRADASGASKITYTGTPANVIPSRSGAASVSAR